MRPESLFAIKSSPANGIDVAACLTWAMRPALPVPRNAGRVEKFRPGWPRRVTTHSQDESRVIHPTGVELCHLRCFVAIVQSQGFRHTNHDGRDMKERNKGGPDYEFLVADQNRRAFPAQQRRRWAVDV
jgi:hypothetical protein